MASLSIPEALSNGKITPAGIPVIAVHFNMDDKTIDLSLTKASKSTEGHVSLTKQDNATTAHLKNWSNNTREQLKTGVKIFTRDFSATGTVNKLEFYAPSLKTGILLPDESITSLPISSGAINVTAVDLNQSGGNIIKVGLGKTITMDTTLNFGGGDYESCPNGCIDQAVVWLESYTGDRRMNLIQDHCLISFNSLNPIANTTKTRTFQVPSTPGWYRVKFGKLQNTGCDPVNTYWDSQQPFAINNIALIHVVPTTESSTTNTRNRRSTDYVVSPMPANLPINSAGIHVTALSFNHSSQEKQNFKKRESKFFTNEQNITKKQINNVLHVTSGEQITLDITLNAPEAGRENCRTACINQGVIWLTDEAGHKTNVMPENCLASYSSLTGLANTTKKRRFQAPSTPGWYRLKFGKLQHFGCSGVRQNWSHLNPYASHDIALIHVASDSDLVSRSRRTRRSPSWQKKITCGLGALFGTGVSHNYYACLGPLELISPNLPITPELPVVEGGHRYEVSIKKDGSYQPVCYLDEKGVKACDNLVLKVDDDGVSFTHGVGNDHFEVRSACLPFRHKQTEYHRELNFNYACLNNQPIDTTVNTQHLSSGLGVWPDPSTVAEENSRIAMGDPNTIFLKFSETHNLKDFIVGSYYHLNNKLYKLKRRLTPIMHGDDTIVTKNNQTQKIGAATLEDNNTIRVAGDLKRSDVYRDENKLKLKLPERRAKIEEEEKEKEALIVHTLPVGAGNCQMVQCPANGSVLMIDCGSRGKGRYGLDKDAAKRFLDGLQVENPKYHVFISHGDSDHWSYVEKLTRNKTIETIWYGGFYSHINASVAWSNTGKNLLKKIRADRVPINGARRSVPFSNNDWSDVNFPVGDPPDNNLLPVCGDGRVKILIANVGDNRNSQSLVILITYKGEHYLFTGDAEGVTQQQVITNLGQMNLSLQGMALMTIPHHGANTYESNNDTWGAAMRPKTIIVSSHERKFNHPKCTALNNYNTHLDSGLLSHTHSLFCWNNNSKDTTSWQDTNKNAFSTNSNGRITYTASADSNTPPTTSASKHISIASKKLYYPPVHDEY